MSINTRSVPNSSDNGNEPFDPYEFDHAIERKTNVGVDPRPGHSGSREYLDTAKIGENEEPDFDAAAEAADAKHQAPTGKLMTGNGIKEETPPWFNDEFSWNRGVNTVTGEVYWNVRPLTDVVNNVISYCDIAMSNAYEALSDDEKVLAYELGAQIVDIMQAGANIDSWLENTVPYAYARDAVKNLVRGIRFTLNSEKAYLSDEGREKLLGMAANAGRAAALLKLALVTAAPTLELNYKAGAWDVFRADAYRNQTKYRNPDEEKALAAASKQGQRAAGLLRVAE